MLLRAVRLALLALFLGAVLLMALFFLKEAQLDQVWSLLLFSLALALLAGGVVSIYLIVQHHDQDLKQLRRQMLFGDEVRTMAFGPEARELAEAVEKSLSKAGVVLESAMLDGQGSPDFSPIDGQTPLADCGFVAFDSETTGLDVTRDRMLSLAGMRMQGRRVFPQHAFDWRVRPDIPVPAASTRIHGLTDEMLKDAPSLAELNADLHARLNHAVLVGHNIGFDLAILRHEAKRQGFQFGVPVWLDTGHLVSALEPRLQNLSLDDIADYLGIRVTARHTALGDAETVAKVFAAILPQLEERGVTTVAEAQAFARKAVGLRRLQAQAGWFDAVEEDVT